MKLILKNDIIIAKEPQNNGYNLYPKSEFYLTASINRVAHIGRIDIALLIVHLATDIAIESFGEILKIRKGGVISNKVINDKAIKDQEAIVESKWAELDAAEVVAENLRSEIQVLTDQLKEKRNELLALQDSDKLDRNAIKLVRAEIKRLRTIAASKNKAYDKAKVLLPKLQKQIDKLKESRPEKEYESKNKYNELIQIISSDSDLTEEGRTWLMNQSINNHKLSYYVKS